MDYFGNDFLSLKHDVEVWKKERSTRIQQAICKLIPEWKKFLNLHLDSSIEFALLHHTLYQIRQCSITQDTQGVIEASSIWKNSSDKLCSVLNTKLGNILILNSQTCLLHNDDCLDSPIFLTSNAALLGEPPVKHMYLDQIIECISVSGLLNFVEFNVGLIVLMESRNFGESTNSFCVSPLLGSLFMDYTDDVIIAGEILIHESIHNWLNQCLLALNIELPLQPTWYSPWKKIQRNAFGIIHATAAFSIVAKYMNYFTDASNILTTTQEYYQFRYDTQVQQLKKMESSFREALELINDRRLFRILERLFCEAIV